MGVKISPYVWPDDYVLGMFHPIVRMWFMRTYSSLTDIQRRAIPLIHKGKSVLMISPTGSGKTLAAFMSAINELFILASNKALENKVYVVYVSPLRALSNDIKKNLEGPIEGIKKLAEDFGLEIPEIRYFVRTGDTKQYERSKMLKKAPHILITTPETLSIVITSKKFRELLKDVKYVIVDEIHELCSSKRGVHLSLSLERLQEYVGKPIVRIGMSATQAPVEEIAKFLVGGDVKNGVWVPRDVYIVKSTFQKDLEILVHSPGDIVTEGPETVNRKMYEMLIDYIKRHRTTLVFTNTRSGAEAVSYKLKELGLESVGTHHSSLSPEVRLKVEDDLKNGRLKAVVTSTSLELGIDIGYVDLVCEIGSPKSISRGIQRIGRSGHAVHAKPKGRFIAISAGDLIECAVIARCAKMGKIDRVRIPENSLDVLAQHIVGMSLERKWRIDEAYHVVKRAYPYRNLSYDEFLSVLEYLGATDERLENLNVYRKIWIDFKEGVFGRKKGARVIYNLNIGTIPEETKYAVVLYDKKKIVGFLSEDFATELKHGDIFVLAGNTYEFLGFKGTRVYVRPAPGRRPTIPSWIGEMLPRSYDLSIEVMKFRESVEDLVKKVLNGRISKEDVIKYLMKEYYMDKKAANVIFNLFKNQILTAGFVPSFRSITIEHYIDEYGKYHIIFHYPFGRKVNDALSRAYAAAIGAKHRISVGITVTDDGFMLTLPKMIVLDEETIKELVTPENIEQILKDSLRNTELFNQRFRHCAVRAFMILRNYKGYEISAKNQYLKAMNILRASKELEKTHPVFIEAYREILTQHMDINGAKAVLSNIISGKWKLRVVLPTDVPMPFSHEIIATGYEDVVLMEDRATVLRKLLQKVKTKVLQENVEFKDVDYLDRYFKLKRWLIIKGVTKDDLVNAVRTLGYIPLSGSENIFERFIVKESVLRRWISEMLESNVMTTVFLGRRYLTLKDYEKYFSIFFSNDIPEDINEIIEKWNKSKSKDQELSRIIRKLESQGIIKVVKFEGTRPIYDLRRADEVEGVDPVEAYKFLVEKVLYSYGPNTVEGIRAKLRVSSEHRGFIQEALKALEDNNIVVRGYFTSTEGVQYMLRKDYENIKRAPILEHAAILFAIDSSWKLIHEQNSKNILVNALKRKIRNTFNDVVIVNRDGDLEIIKLNTRAVDVLRDLEKRSGDIFGIIPPNNPLGRLFYEYNNCCENVVLGRRVIGYIKGNDVIKLENVDNSTLEYVLSKIKEKKVPII